MKIILRKSELLDVLSKVQGLTGRKTSLAITENVLIQTADNKIIVTATDLETGFEGTYPASVESEGVIAINSRKFYDIVKMFPTDQIYIEELENRWIAITSEAVEYHLVAMNPDEFPDIPQADDVEFFEMETGALKAMIEKAIAINVPGDEKRANMIGVNFEKIVEYAPHCVRMVSTDIKRLVKMDYLFHSETPLSAEETVIIPKKGLTEVNKFLGHDGTVAVGIKSNHFIVRKSNETVIINLLDGDFPAYHDLLDINPEYDVRFPREPFLMMLKRMAIVTSEEYKAVIFNYENNCLQVRAVNPNIGESKEKITIEYDREALEVAFNPRYFIEALNFIESENILLNIVDEEHPCIIRGEDAETYINIIMPMKI